MRVRSTGQRPGVGFLRWTLYLGFGNRVLPSPAWNHGSRGAVDEAKIGNGTDAMCDEHCTIFLFPSSFLFAVFVLIHDSDSSWRVLRFVYNIIIWISVVLRSHLIDHKSNLHWIIKIGPAIWPRKIAVGDRICAKIVFEQWWLLHISRVW